MPKASSMNEENRKYMKQSIVNEYIRDDEDDNQSWMDEIGLDKRQESRDQRENELTEVLQFFFLLKSKFSREKFYFFY